MRQMTNESRAEGARSLCLARRNKGYAQIIDIKVPNCWQQLKDNQLRYVYKLLNGNFSLPQVQTLCLFSSTLMNQKSAWSLLILIQKLASFI